MDAYIHQLTAAVAASKRFAALSGYKNPAALVMLADDERKLRAALATQKRDAAVEAVERAAAAADAARKAAEAANKVVVATQKRASALRRLSAELPAEQPRTASPSVEAAQERAEEIEESDEDEGGEASEEEQEEALRVREPRRSRCAIGLTFPRRRHSAPSLPIRCLSHKSSTAES